MFFKPDEFELRIIKALEETNQLNRHLLCFFKGIILSLQNFKEEENLDFQLGVLQLIANINYFHCYTVHVVELLNYYTNQCTYIKFIKFTH